MHSAREPGPGRAMAAPAPRVAATSRTLVWFSADAERRRRTAAAAHETWSRRAAIELGWIGINDRSHAEIHQRAVALRAACLTASVRRGIARLRALAWRS